MEPQILADDLVPVGLNPKAGMEHNLFGGQQKQGENGRHFALR